MIVVYNFVIQLVNALLPALGLFDENIKKGVIKKPPPTPNNPERIPTIPLNEKIASMFTDTSAIGRKIFIVNRS